MGDQQDEVQSERWEQQVSAGLETCVGSALPLSLAHPPVCQFDLHRDQIRGEAPLLHFPETPVSSL